MSKHAPPVEERRLPHTCPRENTYPERRWRGTCRGTRHSRRHALCVACVVARRHTNIRKAGLRTELDVNSGDSTPQVDIRNAGATLAQKNGTGRIGATKVLSKIESERAASTRRRDAAGGVGE